MSENLPAVQEQPAFARLPANTHGMNVGAVAIEQERAIAEAQGQLILAKKFPRSMTAATADFMEACKNLDFAKTAFYSVPNRGSGPSIRLAEEAARCYGNFVYGHRELSRTEGKSEIEVYAWDMEKNNRSSRQITVMHVTDTKTGPKKLTDQTDIDNKIANVASKQMRGRILALMPKHMIASGVAQAKLTLGGGGDKPLGERLIAMVTAFMKFGVTSDMLVKHLGHPVDNTTIDELADLMGIYNAIKEGARASEYFPQDDTKTESGAASLAATAKAAANAAPAQAQAAAPAAATKRTSASKAAQAEGNPVKEAPAESGAKATSAPPPAEATAPAAAPAAAPAEQPAAQAGDDDEVF